MAPLPSMTISHGSPERRLLDGLISLYGEERRLYLQVLELSHRQGQIVRQGGAFSEVRAVLEEKKGCLNMISRLDQTEQTRKAAWMEGRHRWSAAAKAELHAALATVTTVIEEIMDCEEKNDLDLIARTQEM